MKNPTFVINLDGYPIIAYTPFIPENAIILPLGADIIKYFATVKNYNLERLTGTYVECFNLTLPEEPYVKCSNLTLPEKSMSDYENAVNAVKNYIANTQEKLEKTCENAFNNLVIHIKNLATANVPESDPGYPICLLVKNTLEIKHDNIKRPYLYLPDTTKSILNVSMKCGLIKDKDCYIIGKLKLNLSFELVSKSEFWDQYTNILHDIFKYKYKESIKYLKEFQ